MNLLIIGEFCEDIFYYGRSDRLSPEAPIPVFIAEDIDCSLGMAANVERNLVAISKKYSPKIKVNSIFSARGAQKVRYVDKKTNHYFLRVDHGDNNYERIVFGKSENKLIKSADAIIISDYCKGFLKVDDIIKISKLKKKKTPLFIDTKKVITKDLISAVSFLKINQREYEQNFKKTKLGAYINKLIVTLGEKGAMHNYKVYPPSKKHKTMDVSGAGDTFMAAFAFKYMESYDLAESICFANNISGEVVSKRGVSTI